MKLNVINNKNSNPDLQLSGDSAISIGNFDGCHIGHQSLIKEIITAASNGSLLPTVVSFDPRPEDYFRSTHELNCLFSARQKERALDELGVSVFFNQEFNENFSEVTHDKFFDLYLKDQLRAKNISVGENFCFGHKRKGSAYWLKKRAEKENINVNILSPTMFSGEIVSSTRIRNALRNGGRVAEASDMLGRPYLLEGDIVKGNQIGRTIGVPTANLSNILQIIPKSGVYCGYVWLQSNINKLPPILSLPTDKIPAVFNVGHRPTVDSSNEIRIEAHLLSGEWGQNELYGVRAGYWFLDRLRDEIKFAGLDQLKSQISKDIKQAEKILAV